MITPMSMQDGLNEFLENEVASKYQLKIVDRNGVETFTNPQIIKSGWVLPQSIDEDSANDEEFPYIITRIENIKNGKNPRESIVTMLIIFGVYDPGVYNENGKRVEDGSGYRDFWNLVETTRQALFEQQIIDKRYLIVSDFFEAEMLEEFIYPYWEGYCRVKIKVDYPEPILEFTV